MITCLNYVWYIHRMCSSAIPSSTVSTSPAHVLRTHAQPHSNPLPHVPTDAHLQVMKRSLYSGRDGEPDMPFTPGVESSFPEGASTQDPLEPAAWAPSQNDISSSAPTVSPAMETLLPVSAGQANVAPSSVGQQNWEEKIFSLPLVGRAPILCARAAAAAFRLRRRPSAASVKASSHVTAATNYEQEVGLSQGGPCMFQCATPPPACPERRFRTTWSENIHYNPINHCCYILLQTMVKINNKIQQEEPMICGTFLWWHVSRCIHMTMFFSPGRFMLLMLGFCLRINMDRQM